MTTIQISMVQMQCRTRTTSTVTAKLWTCQRTSSARLAKISPTSWRITIITIIKAKRITIRTIAARFQQLNCLNQRPSEKRKVRHQSRILAVITRHQISKISRNNKTIKMPLQVMLSGRTLKTMIRLMSTKTILQLITKIRTNSSLLSFNWWFRRRSRRTAMMTAPQREVWRKAWVRSSWTFIATWRALNSISLQPRKTLTCLSSSVAVMPSSKEVSNRSNYSCNTVTKNQAMVQANII